MQTLTILGATGSIGLSTLNVVAQHPDKYRVVALSAHSQVDALLALCQQFSAQYAVLGHASHALDFEQNSHASGLKITVLHGVAALCDVAALPEVDSVMSAIVGAAGLRPTLAAAHAGKRILLANKESLVVGGALLLAAVKQGGATLLPVDSEHNAIFQALPHDYAGDMHSAGIENFILTASGGPFRTLSLEELRHVTPAQACKHPNWSMGQKISVDSASLMNKGLEVIEAHWLFSAPANKIEVVVHPQSVIHSMVRYIDGSVIAQLGSPDMKTPIAYALAWPQRIAANVPRLDFNQLANLSFEAPDLSRFPALGLAFDALQIGGDASCVLNAANEVVVDAFLKQRLSFLNMADGLKYALNTLDLSASDSVDALIDKDQLTRKHVEHWIQQQP
jgi:1-deoxy-D-xylulose-5-phosphate reductoisomerase